MQTADGSAIRYFYDTGKLARLLVMSLVFTALFILAALNMRKDGDFRHILLWLSSGIFAFLSLVLARRLFSKDPVLVVEPAGLILPQWSAQQLPWAAVQGLETIQRGKTKYMSIRIDPLFAKSTRRLRAGALLTRVFRPSQSKIVVNLSTLKGDANSIFKRCSEAAKRDREARYAASTLNGMPPPDFLNPVEAPAPKNGHPIFTYGLILFLLLVYCCELAFGVDPSEAGSPSIRTLFLLGGTFTSSVLSDGQWWRLFTAPLLHGGPMHLAFNCFSLLLAGSLLERLIGWRWFAGIFFLSALGGSVSSILVNTSNVVGVGASGGIVGLFAAAIAASFHFQSANISETIRLRAIQILVPSLLPILSSVKNGEKVDYAAHVGGALVGVLLAVVMMSLWPKQNAYPRFNKSMSVVTIAFLVVVALSLVPIVATRSAIVGDPMANYAIGNYQRAAGGFEAKAQAATENAPYYYIWQFLAQTHLDGEKAVAELRSNKMNVDPLKWPMPVIDVFLGDGRAEELPGKAADNDQRCEATFYTGEWYRLQNDDVHAIANFQESLALCPKTFLEFDGAKAELSHLGVKGA